MVGCWVQRAICAGRVVFSAALVAGCTQVIRNDPINQPLTANARQVEAELSSDVQTNYDDMVVALSFSGGGMRAAAFSYGVLTGFEETRVPTRSGVVPLLDRLDFLSGVSGGSTLAAYYGLYGRAGIADFKQRFLLVNAEEGLTTNLSLGNIARGLQGGVNDTTQFPFRSRLPPPRRCRSSSLRSSFKTTRALARLRCRPGSNARAATQMPRLC
jgi:NTE family protein